MASIITASRPLCQKNAVNQLIPKLKECGAEDILEIPISKIVP